MAAAGQAVGMVVVKGAVAKAEMEVSAVAAAVKVAAVMERPQRRQEAMAGGSEVAAMAVGEKEAEAWEEEVKGVVQAVGLGAAAKEVVATVQEAQYRTCT